MPCFLRKSSSNSPKGERRCLKTFQRPFPYAPRTPDELNAVIAAPNNHEVVIKNEHVCVLRVVVRLGEVEKKNTHINPSVFIINAKPDMDYFNDKDGIVAQLGNRKDGKPFWVDSGRVT